MHKIVDVNKEMGLSVVMLHYPTFPDFKDLNVFALYLYLYQRIYSPNITDINDIRD